ncbi:MAG: lytic transglycosylase domain-containing protein [Actinobacteria bacterium]|nr:lytic transglycosylase domain-containing protein [Actinomycetota bacterium]
MKRIIIFILAALTLFVLFYRPFSFWLKKQVYPLKYRDYIVKSSREFKIDPYLLAAIIYEESRFRPRAKSSAGALGLMQIMPDTAKRIASKMRLKDFKEDDLFDPELNIRMGSWYFHLLLEKYKEDEIPALAAYNAGYRYVDGWFIKDGKQIKIETDDIPFPETRKFVKRVKNSARRYRSFYKDELEID